MSPRGRAWWVGAAGSVALTAGFALAPSGRDFAVPLGLIALTLSGLVAEGLALIKPGGSRTPRPASHDLTPADGIVGVTPVAALEGWKNSVDPRFRRFRAMPGSRIVRSPAFEQSGDPPSLLGRITLFSIFLGADGRGWTDEEIARGHSALERAGAWLEREAARRDSPVNIDLAEVYFCAIEDCEEAVVLDFGWEGREMGPLEANAGAKYLKMASRAAAGLGFAHLADLQGRVNELVAADRRAWMLHVRRAGRSIAILPSDFGMRGAGLAVCFAREASFPEPLDGAGRVDPTTVVHELLHLFGASDKYGESLRSYPARSVSTSDIMRLDHARLPRMRIDDLTAREIGWRPTTCPSQQKTRR